MLLPIGKLRGSGESRLAQRGCKHQRKGTNHLQTTDLSNSHYWLQHIMLNFNAYFTHDINPIPFLCSNSIHFPRTPRSRKSDRVTMSGDSVPPPASVASSTSASDPVSESKTKLYVGNISYSWAEEDLRDLFLSFGTILSARIPQNDRGQSKGFGFIEFSSEAAAARAAAEMDGKQFGGRTLKGNISVPKPRGSDSSDRRSGEGYGRGRSGYRDEGGYGGSDYNAYAGYPGYGGYGAGPGYGGGYAGHGGDRRERGDYRSNDFPGGGYGGRDPRDGR
jgi:hypothetical protein